MFEQIHYISESFFKLMYAYKKVKKKFTVAFKKNAEKSFLEKTYTSLHHKYKIFISL